MKKTKRILSVLFSIVMIVTAFPIAHATTEQNGDDGIITFNGHYYKLFNEGMSWFDAKAACEDLGGHLITIGNKNENDFITSVLNSNATKYCYWTAIMYDYNLSDWVHYDGSAIEYQNWADNEPNDWENNNEAFVHLYGKRFTGGIGIKEIGEWNDASSEGAAYAATIYALEQFGYICEWDSYEQFVQTGFVVNPISKAEFEGHTYGIFGVKMSWDEAVEFCESQGGHLATITSEEENSAITAMLSGTNTAYWIGAEYLDGTWSWVTDETWKYTNWGSGEPMFTEEPRLAARINCETSGFIESFHGYDFSYGDWDACRNLDANKHTIPLGGFICEWEPDKTKLDYYAEYWDSSKYNGDLVKIMSNISNAVYDENSIRNVYYNTLGFGTFGVFDYEGFFNPNSCGYSFGLKKSQYSDEFICLIAVRGSSNTSDWIGNINIDTDVLSGLHLGFANPAKRIMEKVQQVTKNATDTKIKYFITGHSRGAATANILSYLLMQDGVSASDIFNYNFACPDVACRYSFGNYTNIFNLCNRTDIVAHVPGAICSSMTTPGTSWGKFGQTYWFTKNEWDSSNSLFDNVIANHEMTLYKGFFACDPEFPYFGSVDADEEFDNKINTIGWLTKVLCPVDVVITDVDGNSIASVINGKISYYNNSYSDVIIFTDGDKKIIYTHGDRDYNVDLIGTDTGKMVYSVEKYCLLTGELSESKVFANVELYEGKQMNSPVYLAKTTEDIDLFVVNNENNQSNKTHIVNPDGTETAICIQTNEHKDVNTDNICDICEKILASDDTSSSSCEHICHTKNEFWQFIWKIYNFLMKLFSMERVCSCGVYHY